MMSRTLNVNKRIVPRYCQILPVSKALVSSKYASARPINPIIINAGFDLIWSGVRNLGILFVKFL